MSTPALNEALGVGGAPLEVMPWTLDREAAVATNARGLRVPMRPFLGMLGLGPANEAHSPWSPSRTGGNMDCRELVEGSVVELPVEVAGGWLAFGDGHAAQGDGEVAGTAIECAMDEVRLRVGLVKGVALEAPRARTPGGWVTLGFGATLDAAAEMAMRGMLDLLQQRLGLSRTEALAEASVCVHLRVTQMVNPVRGVHAVLSQEGRAWPGP
jgi:acetamidase/formamidase